MEILFVLALIAAVVAAFKALNRPGLVVAVDRGAARLERGSPPPGLLGDLRDVCREAEEAVGRIEVRGVGAKLDIRTPGLDEGLRQRVRNVLMMYRDRL